MPTSPPTRKRAPFERLPSELVHHILEYHWPPIRRGQPTASYAGLRMRLAWIASLAHLSRAWPAVIYPVLYRTVALVTNNAADRFLRTLERRAPRVSGFVQEIILPGWTAVNPDSQPGGPPQKVYRRIVQRCVNLRVVAVRSDYVANVIATPGAWKNDVEYFAVLSEPSRSTLDIQLSLFPRLRRLMITGPEKGWALDCTLPCISGTRLQELVLRRLILPSEQFQELLRGLCPSLKSLSCTRVLVQESLQPGPMYMTLSPTHWTLPLSETLTDLRLAGSYYIDATGMRHMVTLKTLSLDVSSLSEGPLGAEFFPDSLEHVTFTSGMRQNAMTGIVYCSPWTYARRACEVMALRQPNLKSVTLDVNVFNSNAVPTFTIIAFMLKELASSRGITFNLNLDVLFYNNGDSFQWSWPPSSPRVSTLQRVSSTVRAAAKRLVPRK